MRLIILGLVFCSFFSCSGTKKTVESTIITNKNIEKVKTVDKTTVVDTSISEKGRVTVTEIEFFAPDEMAVDSHDTSSHVIEGANVGFNLIKSIRQTTIEREVEHKGESVEFTQTDEQVVEAVETKVDSHSVTEPAPDPRRWRYIFGILLLLAIIGRKRILPRIRDIFSKE